MQFLIGLECDYEYSYVSSPISEEFLPQVQEYLKDNKYAEDIDSYLILLFVYSEERTKRFDSKPAYYRNYRPAVFKRKTRKIATMQETDYRQLNAAGTDTQLILGVIANQVLKSISDTRKLKVKFNFDQFYEDLQTFFIAKEWIEK